MSKKKREVGFPRRGRGGSNALRDKVEKARVGHVSEDDGGME